MSEDSPFKMTASEYERAVQSDEALRGLIDANKSKAEASGAAVEPDSGRVELIARTQLLRQRLGGYKSLREQAEMAARALAPIVEEYVRLRRQLADRLLDEELCGELGLTPEDLAAIPR